MNDLAALLPLVAILGLFWFMVIRPPERRQQEVASLQQQHRGRPAGDDVVRRLRHGHGSITDDRARLEIAPGTEIEIAARGDRQGRLAGDSTPGRCLTVVRPRRR